MPKILFALFTEDAHPRITCPMALTPVAGPDAAKFAEYLRSDEGRAVFERFGFVVLR